LGQAGIRALLFDAKGRHRDVKLAPGMAAKLENRQLLWIDLDAREPSNIAAAADAVGFDDRVKDRLSRDTGSADVTQYPDHIHLVLEAMEAPSESSKDPIATERREIDLVAGQNWVVAVHDGPVPALARIDRLTSEDRRVGELDAAAFLAGIVEEVLADYLALAERFEREIDQLDEQALRTRPRDDVLARIVLLRRRIGTIRRALTPHRQAFAALAREMELHAELGRPWPSLNDRLERTIDAVENLRDLLLGTYDIHMGRSAHRANEIMKRLTLLSAVLLPAVVLAGIMGMNYQMDFFRETTNFWLVVGSMVVFGLSVLVIARWRGWL
jgi:magnesium transporter